MNGIVLLWAMWSGLVVCRVREDQWYTWFDHETYIHEYSGHSDELPTTEASSFPAEMYASVSGKELTKLVVVAADEI
jgi:hypothetical protein